MAARRGTTVLGAAALVAGAAVTRSLRRYEIAEGSMAPALRSGDYVLAVRQRRPQRGHVVIFEHPARPEFELVKRIVGIPRDRIAVAAGQVHVGDRPLAEPWADGPTLPDGSWNLGSDEVFVLGDQRAISRDDSRGLGPLSVRRVRWRVLLRYWPLSRVGRVA